MSSTGIGPMHFLKTTVNAGIYTKCLEHFMNPSAEKLYGDADLIFQQDLALAHKAKRIQCWFNDQLDCLTNNLNIFHDNAVFAFNYFDLSLRMSPIKH